MKKSLLALAVLGAFAGTAFAQSSVTLYGKIDVGGSYDSNAYGSGAHQVRIDSGITGGSRVGFKGSEDLGGGLRANFQAETGICADQPGVDKASTTSPGQNGEAQITCTGGGFFGRQTWVGLSGGFGSVTLGRQYNPVFLNLATLDPFGLGYAGQINNLFNGAGFRWSNSVMYATPSMSGFQVTVGGSAGETTGNWKANRQMGFNATYSAGPLYAGVAYNQANKSNGDTGTKLWNLGVVYDFGVAKLHAAYDHNTDAGLGGDVSSAASGLVTNYDDYMVGTSVPVGPGTIMASWVHRNDKSSLNHDADQFAVGYNYALSKRTSLYADLAHIRNKNGAEYVIGNSTVTGVGNQEINLGIVHNF
jgi:predicted porin